MKTVLILGANGRFGQAATQAFAGAGWRVLAQMRRAPVAPLPARATAVTLPLDDATGLARAAAGAQVVLHAINPPYGRWSTEALPALHQGLAVCKALGALFMLPGNVYNFGQGMPALLQEATPQRPTTDNGRVRVAMEEALRAEAAAGQRAVVIRAGDFFGCGSGSWLDLAIAKDMARGKLVYPGPLDVPHAWAYLPDLAQAFVAVADAPPAARWEVFHYEGYTLSGQQLIDALTGSAAELGLLPQRGFRTGAMPWGLIRAVGLVKPAWRQLAAMSYLWRVPHALDGSRLAAQVPLPPGKPLQAALTDALRLMGLGQTAGRHAPAP